MDVCCLNRPFDDLSQTRVFFEAEAVLAILSSCEKGIWMLVGGEVILAEISRATDSVKKQNILALYTVAIESLELTTEAYDRAIALQQLGFKRFDSMHIAVAEANSVDVFLTVDDWLLKASKRVNLGVQVENPTKWLVEVLNNEH